MRRREIRGLRFVLLASACLALAPAAAQAETRSFINSQQLFASGGGGNAIFGPANVYPSSILVSGVPGTVTKATVTVFFGDGGSNGDDVDMVLTGPNGGQVFLMSDACGSSPDRASTFDDSAQTFLSNAGPCLQGSFRPSNYLGDPNDPNEDQSDDLSSSGGPAPPYSNALSVLAGGSPNGAWDLFVVDDNLSTVGFVINGWTLTLEIDPPPTPPGGDPGTPSPPSNEFTVGGLDGKKLSVNVSSPGTVSVTDPAAKALLDPSSASGGPGTVEVELDLTKKGKKKLRRKGKFNVDAQVTFTPTGGSASSKTAGLQVKK